MNNLPPNNSNLDDQQMDEGHQENQMNESRMTSASRMNLDQYPEDELSDMICKFDQLRMMAQEERRYLDADKAKKKIKQLTTALDARKKKDISVKHYVEKDKLDNEFSTELYQFNLHWDDKIQKYKEECTKLEELLLEKQKQDFENYELSLEQNISDKPKDSPKVQEFKHQVELLAANQDYQEAHNIQQKLIKLTNDEQGKYNFEREQKLKNLLDQFITRQRNEHNSLRKKIITGLEELEIKREKEYEMLGHKYNNLKRQVESSQIMETQLFEKSVKTSSMLNKTSLSNFKNSNKKLKQPIKTETSSGNLYSRY